MKIASAILAAGFAATVGSAASAATITFGSFYSNSSVEPTPSVTVADIDGGVSVAVSSSGITGKLSGLAFEVSDKDVSFGDLTNLSTAIKVQGGNGSNSGPQFREDDNAMGNINFNSSGFDAYFSQIGSGTFDFIFELASQTTISTTPFTFDIGGVSTGDFDLVGLRFQSITGGTVGSSKIVGVPNTPDQPTPVPVPAAGLLLIGGLGGLAALRRSRAA